MVMWSHFVDKLLDDEAEDFWKGNPWTRDSKGIPEQPQILPCKSTVLNVKGSSEIPLISLLDSLITGHERKEWGSALNWR